MWPTATATDAKASGSTSAYCAARVDGGRLNPDWVEMLMGFPAGWTVIDSPEPEGSSGASGSHRR
jgi:hypothetical protein